MTMTIATDVEGYFGETGIFQDSPHGLLDTVVQWDYVDDMDSLASSHRNCSCLFKECIGFFKTGC